MHSVMVVAVEADDEAGARAAAERWASSVLDDLGDWFEVGGRWSGLFDGADVVRATNREVFDKALDWAFASRLAMVNELRQMVGGMQPGERAISSFDLGDIDDDAHGRLAAHCAATAASVRDVLASRDHVAADAAMAGHYLFRLGRLVAGYLCTDQVFWDTDDEVAHARYVRSRVQEAPEHLWLVALDVHS